MTAGGATPVFVDVQRARSLLEAHEAILVDARSSRAFASGHLPGAVHLPARELNPVVDGVRRLVSAKRLAEALLAGGIGAGPTVIYGARGGAEAAHLWWTLRAFGHPAAYLLDGGIDAWRRAGLPLEEGEPDEASTAAPAVPFAPRLDRSKLAELPELTDRVDDPQMLLLDTRDASEYSGELAAAARGGHLPRAHHFDWQEALDDDGLLRPEAELREGLAAALEAPQVVTYCQSGVRAAHTHAVLTHLGQENARLYLASWGEWGNRQDTPVQTVTEEVDT